MSTLPALPETVDLDVAFRAVEAGHSVDAVAPALFAPSWPAYRRWYLRDGEGERPGYLECRHAVAHHLPELLPTYDRLVDAVGGGDLEARFLSHWTPPPLWAACSLAAWTGDRRVLVRNYDYPPTLCDATVLRSTWNGTGVLAMSDCVLGALDGVNEHGLAVAIAFGGRQVVGEGFGIGIVVRYLLEFVADVPQALEVLARVPVHMAYNVALQDTTGHNVVAYLSPDRPLSLSPSAVAGNRQGSTEWPEHAEFCATEDREAALAQAVADPTLSAESLAQRFLEAPLHRPTAETTWGTVYTAVYDCDHRTLELRWPDAAWALALHGFVEDAVVRRVTMAVPRHVEPHPHPVVHGRPLLIA